MKMENKKNNKEIKKVPMEKIKMVKELAEKIIKNRTFLVASTKNLPSSQFHEIKKNLRNEAEIKITKKSITLRSISTIEKGVLQNMKVYIGADIALFFSDLDPFELSALLSENQSPAKAKAGDLAPEDIKIEPGPTDLVAGPAISELSGVGLKVAVEGGKLTIKQPAVIAKKGEIIKENVAGVMTKLNILPMRVGFDPIAAYDSKSEKIYTGIKIDKKKTLEEFRECAKKSFGFAVNINYPSVETVKYFIAKAGLEEHALNSLLDKTSPIQTTTKEGN